MTKFSTKQALKTYVKIAYERELRECLLKLSPDFKNLDSACDVWSLKATLENFIQNDLKVLETSYSIADPAYALAYAIRRGVITLDEVPAEMHESFSSLLNTEEM